MQPLAPSAVRAVVIEDLPFLRIGLVQALRRLGAARVEAVDSRSMGSLTGVFELVLVGVHLDMAPSEAVRRLAGPGRSVVHVAAAIGRDELVDLLRAGVDAIVSADADVDEIGAVLARVLAGERVLDGVSLAAVRSELVDHGVASSGLSPRERQVLALLATHRTMADIAAELFVSLATVKSHASSVYGKLGARNRAEAVERAFTDRVLQHRAGGLVRA